MWEVTLEFTKGAKRAVGFVSVAAVAAWIVENAEDALKITIIRSGF